jgi:cytochrome c-type biogenesis protein
MESFATAQTVSLAAAFAAGLLSFLSPCILPLLPGYFTFLAGSELGAITAKEQGATRRRLFLSTVFFVLGFSFVFVLMGASASFLGGLVSAFSGWLRIIGGIIIILMGIHVSGLFRIRLLDTERRLHSAKRPLRAAGAFLVGMAFAAGWTPCIGPILGSLLIVAGSRETVGQGTGLLALYAAGLALPFLVLAAFAHRLIAFIKGAVRFMPHINALAGILLILMGIILLFNKLYLFDFTGM